MKQTINNVKTTKQNVEQHECFTIVLHDGKYIITIGNNVISREQFNSINKAKQYIDNKPYELLINTACLIAYQTVNEKQQQKEQSNENEKIK